MATFDDALVSLNKIPEPYEGDPPANKSEYEERITWPEGVTAPTWAEVSAQMALEEVQKARLILYVGGEQDGTVHKQLEKLWDDIHAGKFGSDAKTGTFYNFIADIKADNPKPE